MGFSTIQALRDHIDRLSGEISNRALFPKTPTLRILPERDSCCGIACKIRKTEPRTVFSLEIGPFHVHETQLICPSCQQVYRSQELRERVAPGSNYAFDILVYVGENLFLRSGNEHCIQEQLYEKNMPISLREIGYLGQKFIVYLALLHQESRGRLHHLMLSKGGYILHLDGTCEGDSPHLMSTIDALSGIVLDNVKLSSENSKQMIPWLQELQSAYGDPLAIVRDMGSGISQAIKTVFPSVRDFICHFHFLRDLGKDLFGYEYARIRDDLARHKIRSQLRQAKKALQQMIDENPKLTQSLEGYLKEHRNGKPKSPLMPPVSAYLLIVWVLEAKCELNGFGFPFDRLHFVFYQRLQRVYPTIKKLTSRTMLKKVLTPLKRFMAQVLKDASLQCMSVRMEEKVRIFEQLRTAMRLASPENKKGLNDDGQEGEISTIRQAVTQFRQSEELQQLASQDKAYQKMLQQIDKYWEKLFADPISVKTPEGSITVQPQRTNNIAERLFRDLKRSERKRSGTHSLNKTLKTMMADTLLVKNLNNPQYLEIILKGKKNLAERFAQIDIQRVRQELRQNQGQRQNLSDKMREIAKIPNLPKKLLHIQ